LVIVELFVKKPIAAAKITPERFTLFINYGMLVFLYGIPGSPGYLLVDCTYRAVELKHLL
jgi:hypothetical protein